MSLVVKMVKVVHVYCSRLQVIFKDLFIIYEYVRLNVCVVHHMYLGTQHRLCPGTRVTGNCPQAV